MELWLDLELRADIDDYITLLYAIETNKAQYQNVEKNVTDAIYSQTWELPKDNNQLKGEIITIDKNKKSFQLRFPHHMGNCAWTPNLLFG